MTEFRQRRNWQKVSIVGKGSKYSVWLDKNHAKTPTGNYLTVPTYALAKLIADEFDNQQDVLIFQEMPFTRRSCGVIDWLVDNRKLAIDQINNYAANELLCHREKEGTPLALRQGEFWDPILEWAQSELNCTLIIGQGVMPIRQPDKSLMNLQNKIKTLPNFRVAAFIEMVRLTGSFLLGLSVMFDHIKPKHAWELSRIDEEWQIEKWGSDKDTEEAVKASRIEFNWACEFEFAARELTH